MSAVTPRLRFELDATEFNNRLARYVALFPGKLPQEILRTEMRGLVRLMMRFTPPNRRTQGEKAMKRDIANAVLPLRPRDFKGEDKWSKAMRENLRANQTEAVRALLGRSRTRLKNAELVSFDPSLHTSVQNRRGNVRRWSGKATIDVGAWDAYVAQMLPRVGNARGGWATALRAMGGTVAAYVGRHSYAGTFRDALSVPVLAYIQTTNRSSWAKAGLADRIVADAFRSRTQTLGAKIARAEAQAQAQALSG